MATTISSKRQIVIPKKGMIAAGLKEGSRVKVLCEGHTLRIVPDKPVNSADIAAGPRILNYRGRKATQAEIDAAIADGAAESL
jgi:AbrB family looped-hinge helix DNA binding protein